jgi:phosphatidylinositol kinase/protein kinase (PI-3  family)
MAVLEAFVYDPLLSWRLIANDDESSSQNQPRQHQQQMDEPDEERKENDPVMSLAMNALASAFI